MNNPPSKSSLCSSYHNSPLAMVRNIPKLPFHRIAFLPPWLTLFIAAFVAIISVFSIVTFLCGSHEETKSRRHRKLKTERLGDKRAVARLHSNISSKALLLSKMISWKKVQDEGEDHDDHDDDDEEVIWKKTIIKGEKCRPLDFSGKILYDSDGNQLPDSPHPTQGR